MDFRLLEKDSIHLLVEDIRWLKKILFMVPERAQEALLDDYAEQWRLGMEEAEKDHQRQNRGRRQANTWLRETLVRRYRMKLK